LERWESRKTKLKKEAAKEETFRGAGGSEGSVDKGKKTGYAAIVSF